MIQAHIFGAVTTVPPALPDTTSSDTTSTPSDTARRGGAAQAGSHSAPPSDGDEPMSRAVDGTATAVRGPSAGAVGADTTQCRLSDLVLTKVCDEDGMVPVVAAMMHVTGAASKLEPSHGYGDGVAVLPPVPQLGPHQWQNVLGTWASLRFAKFNSRFLRITTYHPTPPAVLRLAVWPTVRLLRALRTHDASRMGETWTRFPSHAPLLGDQPNDFVLDPAVVLSSLLDFVQADGDGSGDGDATSSAGQAGAAANCYYSLWRGVCSAPGTGTVRQWITSVAQRVLPSEHSPAASGSDAATGSSPSHAKRRRIEAHDDGIEPAADTPVAGGGPSADATASADASAPAAARADDHHPAGSSDDDGMGDLPTAGWNDGGAVTVDPEWICTHSDLAGWVDRALASMHVRVGWRTALARLIATPQAAESQSCNPALPCMGLWVHSETLSNVEAAYKTAESRKVLRSVEQLAERQERMARVDEAVAVELQRSVERRRVVFISLITCSGMAAVVDATSLASSVAMGGACQ